MIRTYRFKLYRAKRNKKLHKQINAACITYNHCIALSRRYYRLYHKPLWANKLNSHLAKLKRIPKFSYLTEFGAQAVQDVVWRIKQAYKLWSLNSKNHIKSGPPGFQKISKYKSFTLHQEGHGWKLLPGNTILIHGQRYKYFKSRDITGTPKTLTIKRDTLGDIYIYIVCKEEHNQVLARSGKSIGFDFGLKTFLTSSSTKENDILTPSFFRKNVKAVSAANRKLSHKKKKSHNRRKARLALARLHKHIANQRKDFQWKLAWDLCGKYALICLEDLNLKAIQSRFGQKTGDLGFGMFVKILEYTASQTGSKVIKVGRFFASSQICHNCGYKDPITKSLSIREWTCPKCGMHHDRDRNAAINILREGERIFAAS